MNKIVYGVEVIQPKDLFGEQIVRYTDDAKDIKTFEDWYDKFPYNEISVVDLKDKNNIKEVFKFSNKTEEKITSLLELVKYFEKLAEEPMLKIPKFYYKVEDKENNNYIFKLSNIKIDNTWNCCKGFVDKNNIEKDYVYVGAKHGKSYDKVKKEIGEGLDALTMDHTFMFDMLRFLLAPITHNL